MTTPSLFDEPFKSDNEGSNALNTAIRAMKAEEKSVIIMPIDPPQLKNRHAWF